MIKFLYSKIKSIVINKFPQSISLKSIWLFILNSLKRNIRNSSSEVSDKKDEERSEVNQQEDVKEGIESKASVEEDKRDEPKFYQLEKEKEEIKPPETQKTKFERRKKSSGSKQSTKTISESNPPNEIKDDGK